MTQTETMSAVSPHMVALEFVQSLGLELTVFAVTLVLAAAFHGIPTCGPKAGKEKGLAKQSLSKRRAPSGTSTPPPGALCFASKTVERMVLSAHRRQPEEAMAIYEKLVANDEHKNILTGKEGAAKAYNMLVQSAGALSRHDLMDAMLDDMTECGIERSLTFYENTMKLLASKKCAKQALAVYGRMEADGLEPSSVALSCLINFASETGDYTRAIGFFDRLTESGTPSIRAYMTIMRVHAKRQDWNKSLALIRNMQARECPIDSLVLNVILATGVSACRLEPARELLKEFASNGIADVVSYNTLMKGFAQQKDADGAIRLIHEMCQTTVKPNSITFNTAMDAAGRSSRIMDVWTLLARMCDCGVAPDKFTSTTVLKGLTEATPQQLGLILDLLKQGTSDYHGYFFKKVIEVAADSKDSKLIARSLAILKDLRSTQPPMLSFNEFQRISTLLDKDAPRTQSSGAHPW